MIKGFLFGLAIAFVLSLFGVDATVTKGLHGIFGIQVGMQGYYVIMGVIGIISTAAIGGFITGLIVAYLLSFVGADHLVVKGIVQIFKTDIGISGYYLILGGLGALSSILKVVRAFFKPLNLVLGHKK